MDAPKFICDECKKDFSLQPVDIRSTRITIGDNDYIVRYFICPNCYHVYVFMFLQFNDLSLILAEQNIQTQYQMAIDCKNKTLAKRLHSRLYSLRQLLENEMKKVMLACPNGFVYNKGTETIYYREKSTE